jgi:hypothetical protein
VVLQIPALSATRSGLETAATALAVNLPKLSLYPRQR